MRWPECSRKDGKQKRSKQDSAPGLCEDGPSGQISCPPAPRPRLQDSKSRSPQTEIPPESSRPVEQARLYSAHLSFSLTAAPTRTLGGLCADANGDFYELPEAVCPELHWTPEGGCRYVHFSDGEMEAWKLKPLPPAALKPETQQVVLLEVSTEPSRQSAREPQHHPPREGLMLLPPALVSGLCSQSFLP